MISKLFFMRSNYEALDTSVLQNLYEEQSREIERAVLSGNAWETVSLKRKRLMELSSVLHDKLQSQNNHYPTEPAASLQDGRRGPL